jgi:hypothetical protein
MHTVVLVMMVLLPCVLALPAGPVAGQLKVSVSTDKHSGKQMCRGKGVVSSCGVHHHHHHGWHGKPL